MNARMGDTHFIIFHRLDRHKKLFLQKEHLCYHAHHRIMNHLKLYLTPTALSLPVNEAPVAFSPALKKTNKLGCTDGLVLPVQHEIRSRRWNWWQNTGPAFYDAMRQNNRSSVYLMLRRIDRKVNNRNTAFMLQSYLPGMCVCMHGTGQRSILTPAKVKPGSLAGPAAPSHWAHSKSNVKGAMRAEMLMLKTDFFHFSL